MNRRNFLKTAGIIAGAFVAGKNVYADAQKHKRPNIILCMADDQGWGDMEYYGHNRLQTPNLNDLAKSGTRFDRFYAAAPVCSPTRGSVLTGRHPNRFGCFQWGHTLRPQEVTIAEVLREVGYITGHFGKWHIGSVRKGSPVNPGASGFDEWLSSPNYYDNDPVLSRNGVAVKKKGESSIVVADAAIDFISKHSRSEQPFFAVVWFGSPHSPHIGTEENLSLYPDAGDKQHWYAEITGIDKAVGKLRDQLRYLGIEEDTVLWYCSDNGGLKGLSNTGGRGHKGMLYEGGLRVPAIIEWQGRIKAGSINVPCNTSDIFPTLVDMVGLENTQDYPFDGVSLVSVIDGKTTKRDKPMGFWAYPTDGKLVFSDKWMNNLLQMQDSPNLQLELEHLYLDAGKITNQYPEDEFPGHSAWLDWPMKLHRLQDKKGEVVYELYNLETDPYEQHNIVQTNATKFAELKAGLIYWLQSVVDSMNGKDYRSS